MSAKSSDLASALCFVYFCFCVSMICVRMICAFSTVMLCSVGLINKWLAHANQPLLPTCAAYSKSSKQQYSDYPDRCIYRYICHCLRHFLARCCFRWRLFVCVSRIILKVMGGFSWSSRIWIGRLWTWGELIKVWKLSGTYSGYRGYRSF